MKFGIKLYSMLALLSLVAGCTSTGALEIPVYKNSNALKLSGEEISKLIVGKKATISKFKGVILYHADGKYEFRREGSTFIATYRIQGDVVCLYRAKKRGNCANIFKLNDSYYWSNPKKRKKFTAVIDAIENIDGENVKSAASASVQ